MTPSSTRVGRIYTDYGGKNLAVTASGADLAKQIEELRLVERDVATDDFKNLHFSADLQGSPLMIEIDPAVWLTMHRDENELRYAVPQLSADYRDLDAAMGHPLRPRPHPRPQPSRARPRLLVREPGS